MKLKPYEKYSLTLFTSETAKNTTKISEIGDLISVGVNNQLNIIKSESSLVKVDNYAMDMASTISEVIKSGVSKTHDSINLIPDLESIPKEIKDKLKKGIYTIGESRQVEGNLRPVILDEKGVRIKDITLKKSISNKTNDLNLYNLNMQMQIKELKYMIENISRLQEYQLDNDRNNNIIVPFFNARDKIVIAQETYDIEQRKNLLEQADDYLMNAINAIYADIDNTSKHLAKLTSRPSFHMQSTVDKLINYLSSDIELVSSFTGVKVFINTYLGNEINIKRTIEKYSFNMHKLIDEKVGNSKFTCFELLQDNSNYTSENLDFWYDKSIEIKNSLIEVKKSIEAEDVYLISLEDETNE